MDGRALKNSLWRALNLGNLTFLPPSCKVWVEECLIYYPVKNLWHREDLPGSLGMVSEKRAWSQFIISILIYAWPIMMPGLRRGNIWHSPGGMTYWLSMHFEKLLWNLALLTHTIIIVVFIVQIPRHGLGMYLWVKASHEVAVKLSLLNICDCFWVWSISKLAHASSVHCKLLDWGKSLKILPSSLTVDLSIL